jgi:hypothetical protein
MARPGKENTRALKVRILELPAPVRCACGALLLKAHGPARLQVRCRRCRETLEVTIS